MQQHKSRQKDYFIPGLVIVLVAVTLSVWPQPSRANAEVVTNPDQLRSGGLLFRMHEGYAVATTLNTVLDIEATGLVARVSVRQTFRNDGQQWVEGVYVFPLPDNAAVDRMKLYIGERFIEGEIRQKQKARKEYERAKKAGKKASLTNQQRANLFTTAVANIAPGETVTVEIEYQQTIGFDEGIFRLRFPLTMTPRYVPGGPTGDRRGSGWAADTRQVSDASLITPPFVTSSVGHKVTMIATINAGMALDFVASRYHPVNVDEKNGTYRVTFSGQDVPMDHDLELIWRPNASSAPRALVFSEDHDKQTHLLLLLVPPSDTDVPVVSTPRELVFVIDTSGSMHGTSIDQARKALLLALDGLRPSDRFNIIQFNSVTHALFPNPADASPYRVQLARRYVRQLQANGGTEMRPALEKALRYKPAEQYLRQIIFITDGSVANEDALFRLMEKELGNARMFTVGIGSAPNGWFMSKAAEVGRGTYTFISAQHEVNEKMASLFRKLEQPQVTNIDVRWPHGMTVDAYPKKVPDLYNGEPVILKVRLGHEPQVGDNLIIGGDTVMGRWQAEVPLATRAGSAGIATLWARARIADLEDRQRRGEDRESVRMAIVETALSHHLVSRHTSLVAVDKTPVRPASEALGKSQLPNLLPHGQNQQAILGFAATATTAPLNRIIGASCLILAMFVWLGRVMGYGHGRLA